MAVLALAGVTDALSLILADRAKRQFREDSVLLNLLEFVPASNANLTYAVKFDGRSAGGAYAAGAAFNASEIDSHTRDQATAAWANYRHAAEVADETMDIVSRTGGAEGFDILATEVFDAIVKLSRTLGAAVYAGAGPGASPPELGGAAIAIDNSTSAFYGIDRSSVAAWRATENAAASGLSGLDSDEINSKLIRPGVDATGRVPDAITVPGAVFDHITGLADANADAVKTVRNYRGERVAIETLLGTRTVSVRGVPVIEDRDCTAGTAYAWYFDRVRMRYVPRDDFHVTPAQLAPMLASLAGIVADETEIQAQMLLARQSFMPILTHAAKLGTSERVFVRSGNCQLQWDEPRAFSKITGLT